MKYKMKIELETSPNIKSQPIDQKIENIQSFSESVKIDPRIIFEPSIYSKSSKIWPNSFFLKEMSQKKVFSSLRCSVSKFRRFRCR